MQLGNHYETTQKFFTTIAGILIIIPLSPFICRYILPIQVAGYNIDLILSVIIAIIIVQLLTWIIRPIILPALIVIICFLAYNEYNGNYGFSNVYNDYKTLAYKNWNVREQKQADIISINPKLFENEGGKFSRTIKSKIQYKDSMVRNFSVQHSLQYFGEYEAKYGMLTRYLSLFKYINHNFKYVPDSQRDEYYATPKETILNGLGGDCDDHSILMASCLMSIGATCRLVIVEGHMYPEMFAGDKKNFEILQQAIIQLFSNKDISKIYYHENNGEYWINLDYTADYPGGPYASDKVKLVINL